MADHGDEGDKRQHSSDRDNQGWEQRRGYEYHLHEGDDRPPGWSQGQKTGWGELRTASRTGQEVRLPNLHLSGTPLLITFRNPMEGWWSGARR